MKHTMELKSFPYTAVQQSGGNITVRKSLNIACSHHAELLPTVRGISGRSGLIVQIQRSTAQQDTA